VNNQVVLESSAVKDGTTILIQTSARLHGLKKKIGLSYSRIVILETGGLKLPSYSQAELITPLKTTGTHP